MSQRSQKEFFIASKELMISVGETTMMSKHQIPFDRHLEPGPRRNRHQTCRSTIQFKMPTFTGGIGDRSRQSKLKNIDASCGRNQQMPQPQYEQTTKFKKQSASVLRMAGENAVMDGNYQKKDRRFQSVMSLRIMEARDEINKTQNIASIHKQYLFALSLIKKQATYRDGVLLFTEILTCLDNLNQTKESAEGLELLYLVNKQMGLCHERKSIWIAAIEHYKQSIDCCRKFQQLTTDEKELDLEICEITLMKAQCQFNLKQIQQAQRDVQTITNKAQEIIDNFGDNDNQSDRFRRAILVHAMASKLCGEMLENKNHHKQAQDIFVKANDLVAGVFLQDPTPESTKLMQQLTDAVHRTKLTLQFLYSGSAPTFDLMNGYKKDKEEAEYIRYLTQPNFSRLSKHVQSDTTKSTVLQPDATMSPNVNRFNSTLSKPKASQSSQNPKFIDITARTSTEFDNMQSINQTVTSMQKPLMDSNLPENQQKALQSALKFRPYNFPLQTFPIKPKAGRQGHHSSISSQLKDQLVSSKSPSPQQPQMQSRNSIAMPYPTFSGFGALSPKNQFRNASPKHGKIKHRYESQGPDTARESMAYPSEAADPDQIAKIDQEKGAIFLVENVQGEVKIQNSPQIIQDKKSSLAQSIDRSQTVEKKHGAGRNKSYMSNKSALTPYISKKNGAYDSINSTQAQRMSKPGKTFKYPKNMDMFYRIHPNLQANKMSGVLSEFYFDGNSKQIKRSPENRANQSVSYNGKTTVNDSHNKMVSNGIGSENFSAMHSWRDITTTKGKLFAKKNFQMQRIPFEHNRTRSERYDEFALVKNRPGPRKKVKSKSRSRSKKVSKSKSPKAQKVLKNQSSQKDIKQNKLIINEVDSEENEQKVQGKSQKKLDLDQKSESRIINIEDQESKKELNLGKTPFSGQNNFQDSGDLFHIQTPRETDKNMFTQNQSVTPEDESLHPNQNLQSEGPDYDAMRSTTAIKGLAQQVEDMRTEQQQQKDMIDLMLKKQDQLLSQQLALSSKAPVVSPKLTHTRNSQMVIRPETASFGIKQADNRTSNKSVHQQVPKSLSSQMHSRQRSNQIGKSKGPSRPHLDVSESILAQNSKTPLPVQNTRTPKISQQKFPRMPKAASPRLKASNSRNRPKAKVKSPKYISSDLVGPRFKAKKNQAPADPRPHNLPKKRILTPSSNSSYKMSYKDGRFLLIKQQRLNVDRQSLEDLKIYADFFEDHQLTISLRLYSRRDHREIPAGHRDLVFILYGEIAMTSNEFRNLASVYLKQVTWKSNHLMEYVDCIKMMVRAAIEKEDQQVKIVESVKSKKKNVYKVIQKVNFDGESQATRREEDSPVVKSKIIEQPVPKRDSRNNLVVYDNQQQDRDKNKELVVIINDEDTQTENVASKADLRERSIVKKDRIDENQADHEDTDGFELINKEESQVQYQPQPSESDNYTENDTVVNQKIDQVSEDKVVEIKSDIEKQEVKEQIEVVEVVEQVEIQVEKYDYDEEEEEEEREDEKEEEEQQVEVVEVVEVVEDEGVQGEVEEVEPEVQVETVVEPEIVEKSIAQVVELEIVAPEEPKVEARAKLEVEAVAEIEIEVVTPVEAKAESVAVEEPAVEQAQVTFKHIDSQVQFEELWKNQAGSQNDGDNSNSNTEIAQFDIDIASEDPKQHKQKSKEQAVINTQAKTQDLKLLLKTQDARKLDQISIKEDNASARTLQNESARVLAMTQKTTSENQNVFMKSQGYYKKSFSLEDSTLKSYLEDPEKTSQSPIMVNDQSKEVIIDLQTFIQDNTNSSKHNTLVQSLDKKQASKSQLETVELNQKTFQMQPLLLEAERLLLAEEFRLGDSETNKTDLASQQQNYYEFLKGLDKDAAGTIRIIITESLSQQQFKVKLKCEKDHIKIQAVNLNCLQEEIIKTEYFESPQRQIQLLDVQVFQKLDYDQAVLALINEKIGRDRDQDNLQGFFQESFKIVAKADGEIHDILIEEHKHAEENSFMGMKVHVETTNIVNNDRFINNFNIFTDLLDISESKFKKAKADKLLTINYAQQKIKAILKRTTAQSNLRHYLNAKTNQENYIKRSEEQQMMRSTSSRDDDPIMPENLLNVGKRITRQGMFVSGINKAYAFYYKIHSSEDMNGDSSNPDEPITYCWSFYVKIVGARTITVWQYHRFAEDILEQIQESRAKGGDDPNELLKVFLQRIGKETADMILQEAEDEKADFKLEDTEPDLKQSEPEHQPDDISLGLNDIGFEQSKATTPIRKERDKKKVVLNAQEQRCWEIYWIQNLRQQLHLEL